MKTLRSKSILILTLALLQYACTEPKIDIQKPTSVVKPGEQTIHNDNGCTVILVGDKDGFGMNLLNGGVLPLKGGTQLPVDHRGATDPRFTDIYSAEMGGTSAMPYQILYAIDLGVSEQISSAKFRLRTLGIQDGDCQVYGSDTDIKVYIDNKEIPRALDDVDQFDFINGVWTDFVSEIEIAIPSNLLYLLEDGKVEVRWEILQTNPDSQSHDGFAIDYCELVVCR